MERKYLEKHIWKRILEKRFAVKSFEESDFSGYVSIFKIDKVREPLIIENDGEKICLADDGYTWLQHLPHNQNYTITTMLDDKNEIFEWYIDITFQNGKDENGMHFYDDLYLDVVVLPNSKILLLDEDELVEALQTNIITIAQYDLAYKIADKIINGLANDVNNLEKFSRKYLEIMGKNI